MNLVGDCAARTGEQFPMVLQECESMRDDFAAGVTWARERPMYELPDGRMQAAGECADSEDFFVHQKDYSVCDAMPDYDENKLYQQYRIKIAVTGAQEYRTAVCQPDTEAIANLEETGTGCESFHNDYDGFSLGGVRIVRTDTGDVVRGCAEGAIRYEHQREAQGWQADDSNLQAFPLEALYITLPQPAGKTYVEQAVLRDDAQPEGYSLLRSFLRNTDVEYVEDSCIGYQNRDTIQVYERPDGTEYEHNAGAATPLNLGDTCYSVVSGWTLASNGNTGFGGECGQSSSWHYNYRSGTYQATRQRIRPDGVTVATETAQKGVSNCAQICTTNYYQFPGCPSEWTNTSDINAWRSDLGWF
jgi:hypothetical protein